MALPIVPVLILGAMGGAAAGKGTAKIREMWNKGETVSVACPRCGNHGPHEFAIIDRSWGASATLGAATGAIGGTVGGFLAKRIFRCRGCNRSMYEDGSRPSWNADAALKMFVKYPELQAQWEELQSMVARDQELLKKYRRRIDKLEKQLTDERADKAKLKRMLDALLKDMKRAA